MKSRAVRIALFLLVLLALGGTGYELATLDRQSAATRDAARAFDDKARQVDGLLRELRAAHYGSVAPGQNPAYWTSRTTTLLSAIDDGLTALHTLDLGLQAHGAQSTGAILASAKDDLAALRRIDASVQGYLREDQKLLASDLVFADLREAGQSVAARIDEARNAAASSAEGIAEQIRKMEIATAAGAAAFTVLVLILLLPAGKRPQTAEEEAVTRHGPGLGLNTPAIPAEPTPPSAVAQTREPAPVSSDFELALNPAVDWPATSRLCSEFARVRETGQLPMLLERVAAVLDAAGIVVWTPDAGAADLRPALTCGYAPQALAHIRAIAVDDDNATAGAYQDRQIRVVRGDGQANGAIAVPLVGPDGCAGVMAAEIRGGRERDAGLQAAASILAAQLATLVAPAGAE